MVGIGVKFLTWAERAKKNGSQLGPVLISLAQNITFPAGHFGAEILHGDITSSVLHQPQLPSPQEPELQPPPLLIGFTEVMPKPERGPASM